MYYDFNEVDFDARMAKYTALPTAKAAFIIQDNWSIVYGSKPGAKIENVVEGTREACINQGKIRHIPDPVCIPLAINNKQIWDPSSVVRQQANAEAKAEAKRRYEEQKQEAEDERYEAQKIENSRAIHEMSLESTRHMFDRFRR
jgi:hypothetical protein